MAATRLMLRRNGARSLALALALATAACEEPPLPAAEQFASEQLAQASADVSADTQDAVDALTDDAQTGGDTAADSEIDIDTSAETDTVDGSGSSGDAQDAVEIFVAQPCDDKNYCTIDDMTTEVGGCKGTPKAGECDDGNACTENDLCSGDSCTSNSIVNCDDKKLCTDDSCEPQTGCVHKPNVAPCDDDNDCTAADQCADGECKGGKPLICVDSEVCTEDACEIHGGCKYPPVAAGTGCDDSDACTQNDQCAGGKCSGQGLVCNDGKACTGDTCDPAKGCVFTPVVSACDDGNACTEGDACDAGACGGKAVVCSDGQTCTLDECETQVGCKFPPVAAGTVCTDGNACTQDDQCAEGKCGGQALVCNDGKACTGDTCDPAKGCVFAPVVSACDDGNACTEGDACDAGDCGGKAKVCDDGEPCTDDGCDPKKGCTFAVNAKPCSDGTACTVGDACDAGKCKPGKPQVWERSWGGPADEVLRDLVVLPDGNLVGAGYRKPNAVEADTLVMTFNAEGAPMTKDIVFGVPSVDMATALTVAQDGATAGVGTVEYPGMGTHMWVGRMVGTQFKYENFLIAAHEIPLDVAATADGGMVVVGKVTLTGATATDGFAARLDKANLVLWNPIPAFGLASNDHFNAVAALADGSFAIAGTFGSAGQPFGIQAWLVILDKFGKPKWGPTGKTFGGSGYDQALDVAEVGNGKLLWSGLSSPDATAQGMANEAWILCTDTAGTIVWQRKFSVSMANTTQRLPLYPTPAGGVAMAVFSAEQNSPRMVQVDAAGNVVRDVVLAAPTAQIQSIQPAPGGWYLGGTHTKTGEGSNFWLARTDEMFNLSCTAAGACFGKSAQDCSDGNVCTAETCDPVTGQCKSGAPSKCDDGDNCTIDSCDPKTGCKNTADTAKCDDGDLCTTDLCDSIVGCSHGKVACSDGNPCTDDSCSAKSGCVATANTKTCPDSDVCNGNEVCVGGVCKSGTAKICDDGNVCTADSCDKVTGCLNDATKLAGQACTAVAGGTCASGTCQSACGPGYQAVEVDIDGAKKMACAALGPVWGNRPDKPVGVYTAKDVAGEKAVEDSQTKLVWQQTTAAQPKNWAEAKTYCDQLVYGGSKDWRLPSVHELATLVDYSVAPGSPAIDQGAFPGTKESFYWTATLLANSPTVAWRVHFNGFVQYNSVGVAEEVRCVRGNTVAVSVQRYQVSGSGDVVTDTWTKLQWQRNVVESPKTWQQAMSDCAALDLDGGGWRLPWVRELHGLVDTQVSAPTLDKTAFPNTPPGYFRTATKKAGMQTGAWSVGFGANSGLGYNDLTEPVNARCVRGN